MCLSHKTKSEKEASIKVEKQGVFLPAAASGWRRRGRVDEIGIGSRFSTQQCKTGISDFRKSLYQI